MNMQITAIEARAMTLRGDDIDTDQIMPSRFLKWITFEGLERHVFEDARHQASARGGMHPFDDPRFAGAGVLLITGQPFGEFFALHGAAATRIQGQLPGDRCIQNARRHRFGTDLTHSGSPYSAM